MKTNLRLLSLLMVTACAAVACARADEPPAGPPSGEHGPRPAGRKMREHRMKMLEEKLQITAAQKDQIKAIWDKAEAQGKALRDEAVLDREARREKMGEILRTTHEQVRAVLTPDQQKTFDAMPPEERGRRGPRPGASDKPADVPPPAKP